MLLERGSRLVQGGEIGVTFLDAPAVDEGFAGEDGVFEGVHSGDGPASGGFGTGGFLGVAAVGCDFVWGHGFLVLVTGWVWGGRMEDSTKVATKFPTKV